MILVAQKAPGYETQNGARKMEIYACLKAAKYVIEIEAKEMLI